MACLWPIVQHGLSVADCSNCLWPIVQHGLSVGDCSTWSVCGRLFSMADSSTWSVCGRLFNMVCLWPIVQHGLSVADSYALWLIGILAWLVYDWLFCVAICDRELCMVCPWSGGYASVLRYKSETQLTACISTLFLIKQTKGSKERLF